MDTGAARTLLRPGFVQAIEAPETGKATVAAVGGLKAATEHAIQGLRLGTLDIPVQTVVCQHIPIELGIDGLLGLDAFLYFRLELDIAAGRMNLVLSDGLR